MHAGRAWDYDEAVNCDFMQVFLVRSWFCHCEMLTSDELEDVFGCISLLNATPKARSRCLVNMAHVLTIVGGGVGLQVETLRVRSVESAHPCEF